MNQKEPHTTDITLWTIKIMNKPTPP